VRQQNTCEKISGKLVYIKVSMDKKQARDSRNKTEIQTRLSMDVEAQKT